MRLLIKKNKRLHNFWWVAIFFLVLATLTFPLIFASKFYKWEITMSQQALVVIATSYICQWMKKRPLIELTGAINKVWFKNSLKGMLIEALLMLIPAFFLYGGNWVHWEVASFNFSSLLLSTYLFFCAAIAEEFLFRGFLFQQLISSIGMWGAQLLIAGYFLLTHMNNPEMIGHTKLFVSLNIFLASIIFGLAFIKTNSLAIPIGLHFMANWVQGVLLGFGVSGNEQTGLLKPIFNDSPKWLTGGNFGLEASVPGLVCVILMTIFIFNWKPYNKQNL